MAGRSVGAKLKAWISHLFTSGGAPSTPNRPQSSDGQGGTVQNIQNTDVTSAITIDGDHSLPSHLPLSESLFSSIVINNPTMTSIQSVQNSATHIYGDSNKVTYAMKLLSNHIIRGAAHDSLEREPLPRCHPNTRLQVIGRIMAWFDGRTQQVLLLWINGPAGVGKSALVQTITERLLESKRLGASVFIFRLNKHNNFRGIFITIAYQLATRIEQYRSFIAERVSQDPEVLGSDIGSQFRTFIVEPFVEKKIGAGMRRWGVLLDGLDELEEQDAQCIVIRLISSFVHEHPDAPLVWIIASRPELHIPNMFEDDAVRHSHWSEYLPIDSTEARDDVERFLRSSFEMIRRRFPESVPSDWPSGIALLALRTAASGLFIYAQVVMRFIRDPNHTDPISQLKILVSMIDASHVVPTKDNPFAHLDVLYHEILSSIPTRLWPTAKRLLGFVIHHPEIINSLDDFDTLRGMAILFGLTPRDIYACLVKCYSTLRVPDWNVAHKETLVFFHASFAHYLEDFSRSREFYVGSAEDVEEDITFHLVKIWNECSGDDITTAAVESTWHQYCSKSDVETPEVVVRYQAKLFHKLVDCLVSMVCRTLGKPVEPPIDAQLIEIHMIKLCYYMNAEDVQHFVWHLLRIDVNHKLLLRQVQLKDLKFGHLDWKEMSPVRADHRRDAKSSEEQWILHRPHSSAELEIFVSEVESLQEGSSELEVIIVGGAPKGRVAVFKSPLKGEPESERDFIYYIIPCPE